VDESREVNVAMAPAPDGQFPGGVRLRAATLEDEATVLTMARHMVEQTAYHQWVGEFDVDRFTGLYHLLVEQLGVVLLAFIGDAPVGFLAAAELRHPMLGSHYAEEVAWWVEPSLRGVRLVGPRLLGAFEQWARERQCVTVKMVAPFGAPGVTRFYERAGYAEVETHYIKRLT
jgi:hypothetical protein